MAEGTRNRKQWHRGKDRRARVPRYSSSLAAYRAGELIVSLMTDLRLERNPRVRRWRPLPR